MICNLTNSLSYKYKQIESSWLCIITVIWDMMYHWLQNKTYPSKCRRASLQPPWHLGGGGGLFASIPVPARTLFLPCQVVKQLKL